MSADIQKGFMQKECGIYGEVEMTPEIGVNRRLSCKFAEAVVLDRRYPFACPYADRLPTFQMFAKQGPHAVSQEELDCWQEETEALAHVRRTHCRGPRMRPGAKKNDSSTY